MKNLVFCIIRNTISNIAKKFSCLLTATGLCSVSRYLIFFKIWLNQSEVFIFRVYANRNSNIWNSLCVYTKMLKVSNWWNLILSKITLKLNTGQVLSEFFFRPFQQIKMFVGKSVTKLRDYRHSTCYKKERGKYRGKTRLRRKTFVNEEVYFLWALYLVRIRRRVFHVRFSPSSGVQLANVFEHVGFFSTNWVLTSQHGELSFSI